MGHPHVDSTRASQRRLVAVIACMELVLCLLVATDLPFFVGPIQPGHDWLAMHTYVLFGSLLLGLQAFGAGLWCRWTVSVAGDLRALGLESMRHKPAELVYGWFIPVLNLVRPYSAMVELWKASVAAARGTRELLEIPTRPWLVVWWTLWVIHLLAFPLAVVAVQLAEDKLVQDGLFYLGVTIRHVTLLAAAPLAIALVREIGRNHTRAVERAQMEAADSGLA